jgi:hypothetical protein
VEAFRPCRCHPLGRVVSPVQRARRRWWTGRTRRSGGC